MTPGRTWTMPRRRWVGMPCGGTRPPARCDLFEQPSFAKSPFNKLMTCRHRPDNVSEDLRTCIGSWHVACYPVCANTASKDIFRPNSVHHCLLQEKLETHAAGGEAGGDDLDDDFAAGSSEDGESGDDSGSGSGDECDEEGAGPLQRRQRERAAGDHELQARLRWGR